MQKATTSLEQKGQRGEVKPGVQSQDALCELEPQRRLWATEAVWLELGPSGCSHPARAEAWRRQPRHTARAGRMGREYPFSPFPFYQSFASTSHWPILTGSWQGILGNVVWWSRIRAVLGRCLKAKGQWLAQPLLLWLSNYSHISIHI